LFYFKCPEHGKYKVTRETFMKFLKQSKLKNEVEERIEEDEEIEAIIEFKDQCPRCTKKGKSKARVLIRTPKNSKAPYKKT